MNKDEFVFVNEQRAEYVDLIMMKHKGTDKIKLREFFYNKLNQWRDVSIERYNQGVPPAPQPNKKRSWNLIPL